MNTDQLVQDILKQLEVTYSEKEIKGMQRFGITAQKLFGTRKPVLRQITKPYRKNHELALRLWDEGYLETRIMAAWIDEPKLVTEEQMELWIKDIDSWDMCDQTMGSLFDKTPFAYDKAVEWTHREPEFEKRAGYVLMATLAVHDKKAPDEKFYPFLELISKETNDNRNFVKKAVNWALRQIGKRNMSLNEKAVEIARDLSEHQEKDARWIGKDAYRELTDPVQLNRIRNKRAKL